MVTEELSENPDWRATQRERERERRRIRDRQRRQSMSLEEREKHLARRRRNYQLRRQRAAVNTGNGLDLNFTDEHLAIVPVTELNVQSNGISSLDLIEAYENQVASGSKSEGAHDSSNHPRKLRLHQIKHLARLLNTSVDEPSTSNLQFGKCESRKSIRFVHVKRLARALKSTMKSAMGENPCNAIQGDENMLESEMQMTGDNAQDNESLITIEDNEL